MKTNILANTWIATSVAVVSLVAWISTALAIDLKSQSQRGSASVKNSSVSERGIIIVDGKGTPSRASTSEDVLCKYKKKHEKYQVQPGDEVGLNPQPLPPKNMGSEMQLRRNVGVAEDLKPGFKPQPLPPKGMSVEMQLLLEDPGKAVGLNQQPLPPKDMGSKVQLRKNMGEAVGLNPQPLPPKDMGGVMK